MRTIEVNIFGINELSDKAKEKAWMKWQEKADYPWADENRNTMREFEKIFPIKVTNWEYGYRNDYDFEMTCEDIITELEGFRLQKYIWNNYRTQIFKGKYRSKGEYVDGKYQYKSRRSRIQTTDSCVLTGYYIDDDILGPVYEYLNDRKPNKDFKELMNDCLDAWIKACESDYDACFTLEYFIDHAEANDYEFTEDGKRV